MNMLHVSNSYYVFEYTGMETFYCKIKVISVKRLTHHLSRPSVNRIGFCYVSQWPKLTEPQHYNTGT